MKIIKILNNNTLIVDVKGKEFVVLGKGLGFNKKIGDDLDYNLIEKKFSAYNIPLKYYEITKDIVDMLEKNMKLKLNPFIYVSLADHIYNAILRLKKGENLKNNLLNEIKVIYKEEFKNALDIITYIFKATGILLPEDEAGFITMHIVNSLDSKRDYEVMINVNEIMEIISKYIKIEPFNDFAIYSRLITHLKYLCIQKMDKLSVKEDMDEIFYLLEKKNKFLIEIIKEIEIYINNKFETTLSKSEYVYLMLYIKPFI